VAPNQPAGILTTNGLLPFPDWIPFTYPWNLTGQPAAAVPAIYQRRTASGVWDYRSAFCGRDGSRAAAAFEDRCHSETPRIVSTNSHVTEFHWWAPLPPSRLSPDPLFYQPDLVLRKCARNSVRYPCCGQSEDRQGGEKAMAKVRAQAKKIAG